MEGDGWSSLDLKPEKNSSSYYEIAIKRQRNSNTTRSMIIYETVRTKSNTASRLKRFLFWYGSESCFPDQTAWLQKTTFLQEHRPISSIHDISPLFEKVMVTAVCKLGDKLFIFIVCAPSALALNHSLSHAFYRVVQKWSIFKVCNLYIWWHRKATYIWKCLIPYKEWCM